MTDKSSDCEQNIQECILHIHLQQPKEIIIHKSVRFLFNEPNRRELPVFSAWKDFWPFLLILVSNNEISFSRKSSIQLTKRTDIWSKRVLKSNSCSRVCEWSRFLWINIDTVSIHQVDTVFSFPFICLENKSLTWPGKGWVWKKKRYKLHRTKLARYWQQTWFKPISIQFKFKPLWLTLSFHCLNFFF